MSLALDTIPSNSPLEANQTSNNVAWQGMFWALVAIAFNSVAQPAGRLFYPVPAEYSAALRSSPIISAADSIIAFLYFLVYSVELRSPTLAAQYVSIFRFQQESTADPVSNPQILKMDAVLRCLLFIFGALPQTVKLFAIRGNDGSQVLAGLFLGSFILNEVLMYLGRHWESNCRQNDQLRIKISQTVTRIGAGIACGSLTLSFYGITAGMFVISKHLLGNLAWINVIPFFALAISHLGSLCLKERASHLEIFVVHGIGPLFSVYSTFTISLVILALTLLFQGLTLVAVITPLLPSWAFPVIASSSVTLAVLIPMHSLRKFAGLLTSEAPMWIRLWFALYFIEGNLLGSFLFYAFKYDATRTFKPSWTEYLG